MRLIAILLLLFAALAAASSSPPPVQAHALLVRAEPPVNAMLQDPPREITLYFSEPLEPRFSSVSVVDQDGNRPQQRLEFDRQSSTVMRVLLEPEGPGFLIVSWETVSVVDGHRITGSFPITLLNPDGSLPAVAPPAAVSTQGEAARADLAAAKFFQLAAGCVLTGALLFVLWVSPALRGDAGATARRASDRRCLLAALLALVLIATAAASELQLQAADLGAGVGDVLRTRWGERWLLRLLLFAVPLLAVGASLLASPRRWWLAGGLVATAAALATLSSTSHAAAGAGAFWATAVDFVHIFAASVWLGMLAMLALLFLWTRRALPPATRTLVLATALRRFSSVAVVSVALLLLTGTLSATVELARLRDLLDTTYGRVLLLKLLLVLPLLTVAGYNAFFLKPRYTTEADATTPDREAAPIVFERRFAATMRAELALAVIVLLVAAFLVQITPTRAASAVREAEASFSATRDGGDFDVTLAAEPGRPGFNSFTVALEGDTSAVEQVRLEFFDRSGASSESRLILDGAAGAYFGQGPFIDKAGDWQVRVNIRQSQGSDLSVPFELSLAEASGVPGGGGDFDSPFAWTLTRSLLVALATLCALLLVVVGWHAGGSYRNLAAPILRRVPWRGARRAVKPT